MSYNYNDWAAERQTNQQAGFDAPLGDLDSNQYRYASFTYPIDLGAPGSGKDHYMVFHINETSTTQFLTRTANGSFVGNGGVAPTDVPTRNDGGGDDGGDSTTGGGGGDAEQQGFATGNKVPIRRVATTIVLYMPPDIQVNYGADWEVSDMGMAEDLTNFFNKERSSSLRNLWESGKASVMKDTGVRLNEFTGLNLKDAISAQNRIVINNHSEVIFNGVGFRQFQFNFRLTPSSEDEALNIDNIINAFKFYSAPEVLSGTAGRFWIYPGEFDIQYYSNGVENQFLNKISTCALVNMQVNYTAAGEWSAHRPHSTIPGCPPVCTDISLTFKELEIITKKRILQNY